MKTDIKEPQNSLKAIFGFNGKIYFGVPESSTIRSKIGKNGKSQVAMTNANLLKIHENGSPVKNIPPRELLEPVLIKHKQEIEKVFTRVYDSLINNDTERADYEMEKLAQRIQMWTQKFFVEDNGWTPNKPATIKRKGSDRPLIDTGELRKSIRGVYKKGR